MEKKSFSMGGGIVGGAKGAVGGCCGGEERKRQMGMGVIKGEFTRLNQAIRCCKIIVW